MWRMIVTVALASSACSSTPDPTMDPEDPATAADGGTPSTSPGDPIDPGPDDNDPSDPTPPDDPSDPVVPYTPDPELMSRYNEALATLNAKVCECDSPDAVDACVADANFGQAAFKSCSEMVWEAHMETSLGPVFACDLAASETLTTCLDSACDLQGCGATYQAETEACPEVDPTDYEAFVGAIQTCITGDEPSSCPESSSGSDLGDAVFTGTTMQQGDDFAPDCVYEAGGADVALRWTAPEAGTYTISTTGSNYDTTVAVFDSCEGSTALGCNDDIDYEGGDLLSAVDVGLTAGQEIIIVVDGALGGSAGDYQVNIATATPAEDPPTDDSPADPPADP